MLRRPDRKSALSLTRATRISGHDGGTAIDADAIDVAMDLTVSRCFNVSLLAGIDLDDSPPRGALSSVVRITRGADEEETTRLRARNRATPAWKSARAGVTATRGSPSADELGIESYA